MISTLRKFIIGMRYIRAFKNWPVIFLTYWGVLDIAQLVCVFRNGIRMKVNSFNHIGTIVNVGYRRQWNPNGYEIKPGDIVVDIGAHIGAFSLFAATSAPNVSVVGYEPDPTNFSLFEQNIKLNRLENVKAYPLAVADRHGKRRLFLGNNDVDHSLIGPIHDNQGCVDVECVTLEAIIAQLGGCNFLKMNCEGAEYEILLNTPIDSLQKVGVISMDCHRDGTHDFNKLKQRLVDAGFEINQVNGKLDPHPHPYLYHTYLYARRREM